MSGANGDFYPYALALICGAVFGWDLDRSILSSIAFIGGFISWIWIAQILRRNMYANATPSTPVTSFNQISLVFAPMIICGLIFVIGSGLGTGASNAIDNYHSKQALNRALADLEKQTPRPPLTSIIGEWKQSDAMIYYSIREDGTLDYADDKNKLNFGGRWTSKGGDQYEFVWNYYPDWMGGKQRVDSVRVSSDYRTFSLTNNYGAQAQVVRI